MKYSLHILGIINFVLLVFVIGRIVKSEREKVQFTPEDEERMAKYFPIMEGSDHTYVEPEPEHKEEQRRHHFMPVHVSRSVCCGSRPCCHR